MHKYMNTFVKPIATKETPKKGNHMMKSATETVIAYPISHSILILLCYIDRLNI